MEPRPWMGDRLLERWRQVSLWVSAVAMGVVGLCAYLVPEQASTAFPWKVGPFLTMTIGGWGIGTAATAILAARTSRLASVYPLHVFLGAFGVLELLAVVAFIDRLQTGHLLTYPYLIGLAALIAGALLAIAVWWQGRPDLRGPAVGIPRWGRPAPSRSRSSWPSCRAATC